MSSADIPAEMMNLFGIFSSGLEKLFFFRRPQYFP